MIVSRLNALVRHRLGFLNALFNALPDRREPEDCLYSVATLMWLIVLGFLCRQGSRNAMDANRNGGQMPANLMVLSGQRRWPSGRPLTAPCTQTVTNFLDILKPECLEQILIAIARTLLRAKLFDEARVFDVWVLVAIDGTKMEPFRNGWAPWRRKYRYVIHAKIIGPNGLTITVLAEPCDFYDTERGKLDCELAAFKRLAPRLKAAFPRQPICLLGDALYACEPVFAICEQYGWKFALTFKEGSHPAAYADALDLLPLAVGNVARLTRKDFRQDMRWVDQVPFGKRSLNVLFVGEIDGVTSYLCAWATNFMLATPERAQAVAAAARRRSRIEESYNVQKNGGFGLEHAFRQTNRGAYNYHLLMQLAHTLSQLLFALCRPVFATCRKLAATAFARLLGETLHARPPPDHALPAFQLRFGDTS